jgi:rod shape-determining protein MreC
MAVLELRQRTGWLFFAVIVGHIILISAQVNTRRGVPMLEAVVFGAFAEVQRAATSMVTGVQDSWNNYFALQQIRRDNQQLTREVTEMRVALQQERALASQTRLLQQLLDLRGTLSLSTTAGNVTQSTVIGGGPSPAFRTITIDKGSHEGVRQDMAVIAPAGVVGRVIMPSLRAAKVQLLIDSNAAAGAMVDRTRAQGVAIGTGSDRLQMDYVPSSADVKAGDQVVTSGIDGIYPKGLVIGQIESVRGGTGDSRMIVIKPAVDFSSLEAVLVVLTPPAGASDSSRPGVQPGAQSPADAPQVEPSTQTTHDEPPAPEPDETGDER